MDLLITLPDGWTQAEPYDDDDGLLTDYLLFSPRTVRNTTMTPTYERTEGYDAGGRFVEWYTDDDAGSGYGDNPRVQRWYGLDAPEEPPGEWNPLRHEEGPDRTDPGYWIDNR